LCTSIVIWLNERDIEELLKWADENVKIAAT